MASNGRRMALTVRGRAETDTDASAEYAETDPTGRYARVCNFLISIFLLSCVRSRSICTQPYPYSDRPRPQGSYVCIIVLVVCRNWEG